MAKGALYAAIGFTAISSMAWAEDLSSATVPLPPGTFTTSAHSDEWKIANALSAGPASITEHAAVIDWPANPKDGMAHARVLRQGTNGWTCLPDVPGRPQHNPMCVDETMMKWLTATLAGKKPGIDRVGLSYMLLGEARQGQGATPAKDPKEVKEWFYVGPHVCFPIQQRTRSGASITISPITSPTYRCSVPPMWRRQSGSFPLQRAATGSRTSQ